MEVASRYQRILFQLLKNKHATASEGSCLKISMEHLPLLQNEHVTASEAKHGRCLKVPMELFPASSK
jgi:hypothetical protein